MEQKTLSRWLKVITAGVGVAAALFYFLILPSLAKLILEPRHYRYFMALCWFTAIPNYLALYEFWKIGCEIGKDNSFSPENAASFLRISRILALEALAVFLGILCFFLIGMGHIYMCLILMFIALALIAISVLAAALSHLVMKAYQMKQENDLTI